MKLLKLLVRNLATYEYCNLDFSKLDYPMFITGRTGSGKTTLFVDAITAALYGKAYGEKTGGIYKELIMKGKQVGEVQLEFEVEGIVYRVWRKFYTNRGSEAKLWKWNADKDYWSIIAYTVRDVDREILKIIGLNFDGLLNSAIVRQGDVYTFLRKKPSERRELLLNILNIRFDELRDKAKDKIRELEKEITRLNTSISEKEKKIKEEPKLIKEKSNLKEKLPKISEEIKKYEKKKEELQKELDKLNTNIGELQRELKTIEDLEAKLREKIEKRSQVQEETSQIENMLKRFTKEKVEKAEEYERKINNLEKIKLQKQSEELKLNDLRQKLLKKKRLEQKQRELKALRNVEEELKIKQQELSILNEQIGSIKGKKSEIEKTLKTLNKLKGAVIECPVCGAPLSKEKREKRKLHLTNELKKLRDELKRLNESKKKLEGLLEKLRKRKSDKDSLIAELRILTDELKGVTVTEEDIKRQESKLEDLECKIRSLWSDIKNFTLSKTLDNAKETIVTLKNIKGQMPRLKELKEKLCDLNKEIAELKNKVSRKSVLEKELSEVKSKAETLKTQIKELDEKIVKLVGELKSSEQRIKDIDKELDLIKGYKLEVEKEKEELGRLELDKRAYKLLESRVFSPGALPAKLLEEYIETIEIYANDYLKTFGQNINISLNLVKKKEQQSINLNVYANGYLRRISTFSGGESTLIGFAIRLAVGKMLAELYARTKHPRFLIIDEGFGPLDEELRQKVAEALARLYETREYEQIVVISHQEDLRTHPVFKTILEITKDISGLSQVRGVTGT